MLRDRSVRPRGGYRAPVVGAFALGLVLASVLWSATGRSRAARPSAADEQVLQFDVQSQDTVLELAGPGLRAGTEIVLQDRLLTGGREVGHNAGGCVLAGEGEAVCTVTWMLVDGLITT